VLGRSVKQDVTGERLLAGSQTGQGCYVSCWRRQTTGAEPEQTASFQTGVWNASNRDYQKDLGKQVGLACIMVRCPNKFCVL
jgi:hypothetical protein